MFSVFRIFVGLLRTVVEALTALLFASFVVIVLVQVFCRYVLNDSLIWSEEVVRFGLYWMTMLTIALAADRRGHITMDMLEASLGPSWRKRLIWINAILTSIFLGILSYYGVLLIGRSWETMTAITGIPMSLVYMATPIGCLPAIIFTIDAALRDEPAGNVEGGVA